MLEKKKFVNYDMVNKERLDNLRLTVDYKEDLILIRKIFNFFERKKKFFDFNDVIKFLLKNPKLLNLNNKYARNEGFIKKWKISLKNQINILIDH